MKNRIYLHRKRDNSPQNQKRHNISIFCQCKDTEMYTCIGSINISLLNSIIEPFQKIEKLNTTVCDLY